MKIRRLPRAALTLVALLAAARAEAADLALRRVVYSTGGVGYFEFAADVDGPAILNLDVPLAQVDDVLMSLVVFDSAGGVGGLELPGESGTNAAFGDVPFGPEAMDSALAYLNGLQGVMITVVGPRPMTGRLMHVEQVAEHGAAPEAVLTRTRVSVLTEAGLQQFLLEDAEAVQVSDPDLRDRIDTALETLRHSASQDVRHLTIRSSGAGARTVTVGYVAGAPLWKTSYRLALPQGPDGRARLQGWAVLENQTAADWNGVSLTLTAGNPVTFRQALYRSYYVERRQVPVEVFGRILPDVDTAARAMPLMRAENAAQAAAPMSLPMPAPVGMPAPLPAQMAPPTEAPMTSEGAEQTSFTLPTAVILAAGHTASVPILDRQVPATRVGLVQRGRPHPLASVRLVNDTPSSLPAGVLTLYDTDPDLSFAGDARLGGMAVKESRLLSFAEDRRTAVDWQSSQATTIARISAAGGVLRVEERLRTTHRIVLTAPPLEGRNLLVEIPKPAGATLVPLGAPAATEETATAWRLAVGLQPGQTSHLNVAVDLPVLQQVTLTENTPFIERVIGEQGLSDAARAALQHVVDLRRAEAAANTARDQIRARQAAIGQDEDRLRKNLAAVPEGDALHGRLVRQLDADETQLGSLADALTAADGGVDQAHKALLEGIAGLKI